MRKLVAGAGMAAVILAGLSCKSSRQASDMQAAQNRRAETATVRSNMSGQLDTEYLGDSLFGRMPLPYGVPSAVLYRAKSGGIDLNIILQDSTMEYRAVAKPVARSTLIRSDSAYRDAKREELREAAVREESSLKRTGLPWWVWPALVLAAVLGILIKINRIKIF